MKAQKWEKSRETFSDFIHTFPTSTQITSAWHQLVHASLMERKHASADEQQAKNELVASILDRSAKSRQRMEGRRERKLLVPLRKNPLCTRQMGGERK